MAKRRSTASYNAAAAKAAATRARNKQFAARSAAAKKGWATRRRNNANAQAQQYLKRPGGKNRTARGVQPYQVRKYGQLFPGKRYDFRGLTKTQQIAMRDRVLRDATGHYARMLVMTTSEAAYRRLTTSAPGEMRFHLAKQDRNKPYWFWTEPVEIESSLDLFERWQQLFENESETGEVRIIIVEIL